MQVQATLFSALLQQVPWGVFDRAVRAQRADKGHRRLSARSHLATLLLAQLLPVRGLRDIEAVTAAHAKALGRRRIMPVRRSTFADANASRSSVPVEALVPALLAGLSPCKARMANQIAELYKTSPPGPPGPGSRGDGAGACCAGWQIELFFRWLKQHLRIRHFFGRSENAVRLQIAAAIVTFLLLKLLHAAAGTRKATHVFIATLRVSLFHRLHLLELVKRIDRPPGPTFAKAPDPQWRMAL